MLVYNRAHCRACKSRGSGEVWLSMSIRVSHQWCYLLVMLLRYAISDVPASLSGHPQGSHRRHQAAPAKLYPRRVRGNSHTHRPNINAARTVMPLHRFLRPAFPQLQSFLCMQDHTVVSGSNDGRRLPPVTTVIVVIASLISASIIGIIHVLKRTLHIAHLPTHPVRCVLWRILDIVNSVVEAGLDAVSEAVETLLNILTSTISRRLIYKTSVRMMSTGHVPAGCLQPPQLCAQSNSQPPPGNPPHPP